MYWPAECRPSLLSSKSRPKRCWHAIFAIVVLRSKAFPGIVSDEHFMRIRAAIAISNYLRLEKRSWWGHYPTLPRPKCPRQSNATPGSTLGLIICGCRDPE
ncbi:hypothetical protein IF2G_09794 [Cordyceps javanica]|nr:hypothetical protein IF2G_09794 [Cordyceps javanica]